MKIIITNSVLENLLKKDSQTTYIFFHHKEVGVNFYAPDEVKENFENFLKDLSKTYQYSQKEIIGLKERICKEIMFITSDLYLPVYDDALRLVQDPKDAMYLAVFLYFKGQIDALWTEKSLNFKRIPEKKTPDIVSKKDLIKFFPDSLKIFSDQYMMEPQTLDPNVYDYNSPIPKKKESLDDEESSGKSEEESTKTSEEKKYLNYGEKKDFNWIEDDRLDPMFYEKFLHFYGLKCLNDGEWYYLNPKEKEKNALPNVIKIPKNAQVFKMSRIDTGYEDVFQFTIFDVDLKKWQYYWHLFIRKKDTGTFDGEGHAIRRNKEYDCEFMRSLHVVEKNEPPNSQSSDEKFVLPEYDGGSDIFTTELGFSEFSLPEGILEKSKNDAEKYLGIELKKIKDLGDVLKISDLIFDIDVLQFLALDFGFDELRVDTWEEYSDEYDFSFLEDNYNPLNSFR